MGSISYRNITGNPCFNELVYSVLRSADKDDLLKLKGRFLKAAKTEKAAKYFAANASYQEKAALLAEFGVRFFTVIVNDDKVVQADFKRILDKFEANQKASALEALADLGIYVESDKQYIHLLGLMANTTNHPSYKLSLEYKRQGYHAKKWTISSRNKHDNNITETIEDADYVAKMFLSSTLIAERSPVLFDVPESHLKILLYLYTVRHTYVTKERVLEKFLGNFTIQMVTTVLTKLTDRLFVERNSAASPPVFTITSRGIGVCNRYFQTVFNQIQ